MTMVTGLLSGLTGLSVCGRILGKYRKVVPPPSSDAPDPPPRRRTSARTWQARCPRPADPGRRSGGKDRRCARDPDRDAAAVVLDLDQDRAIALRSRPRIAMRPGGGRPYLTALSIRLPKICSIARRSLVKVGTGSIVSSPRSRSSWCCTLSRRLEQCVRSTLRAQRAPSLA